ncbi:MAG: hypothetical protein KAW46_05050 [candidate division Zixibacteria bacterium]|nr:hypothetical protein [candidate division Zixibacteria bacterium]
MKKVFCIIVLATAIFALTAPSEVQAEHSFEFGAGIPRGFMDVSANSFLNISLKTDGHFRWQPVLHESFAAKKSDGNWLAVNVLAGYGLLRFDFNKSRTGFVPFVAAGGGLHFMTSITSKSGPVHDDFELKLLAKTHGFLGVESTHGNNKHFSLKVRFTYPSDLLLDAVYLNYGIRF